MEPALSKELKKLDERVLLTLKSTITNTIGGIVRGFFKAFKDSIKNLLTKLSTKLGKVLGNLSMSTFNVIKSQMATSLSQLVSSVENFLLSPLDRSIKAIGKLLSNYNLPIALRSSISQTLNTLKGLLKSFLTPLISTFKELILNAIITPLEALAGNQPGLPPIPKPFIPLIGELALNTLSSTITTIINQVENQVIKIVNQNLSILLITKS